MNNFFYIFITLIIFSSCTTSKVLRPTGEEIDNIRRINNLRSDNFNESYFAINYAHPINISELERKVNIELNKLARKNFPNINQRKKYERLKIDGKIKFRIKDQTFRFEIPLDYKMAEYTFIRRYFLFGPKDRRITECSVTAAANVILNITPRLKSNYSFHTDISTKIDKKTFKVGGLICSFGNVLAQFLLPFKILETQSEISNSLAKFFNEELNFREDVEKLWISSQVPQEIAVDENNYLWFHFTPREITMSSPTFLNEELCINIGLAGLTNIVSEKPKSKPIKLKELSILHNGGCDGIIEPDNAFFHIPLNLDLSYKKIDSIVNSQFPQGYVSGNYEDENGKLIKYKAKLSKLQTWSSNDSLFVSANLLAKVKIFWFFNKRVKAEIVLSMKPSFIGETISFEEIDFEIITGNKFINIIDRFFHKNFIKELHKELKPYSLTPLINKSHREIEKVLNEVDEPIRLYGQTLRPNLPIFDFAENGIRVTYNVSWWGKLVIDY